jgi:hypothetical protein
MQTVESYGLTLCAIVIANLPDQSAGPDDLLSARNSPVIHFKCFAHMTNMVLGNCMSKPYFATVMQIFIEMQSLLRTPGAITAIRRRCPRYVRTRWFYMVDTLAFMCSHVDVITGYLTAHESRSKEFWRSYSRYAPSCFRLLVSHVRLKSELGHCQ